MAGTGLYLMGAGLALRDGAGLDLGALLLGQLTVTSVQLMTHLANEYWDLEADRLVRHRTLLTGGSGVLVAGRMWPGYALRGALTLMAAGLASGGLVSLAVRSGWPLLIAALAAGIGLGYSAPPVRLSARGLGEPFTALIVGYLTPAMGYVSLAGAPSARLAAPALFVGLLMLAAMLTIELPDLEADAHAGKRTWVVRLGAATSRWAYRLLVAAAAVALVTSTLLGPLPTLSLAGLAHLPAWGVGEAVMRRPGGRHRVGLPAAGIAGVALGAAGVYLGLIIGG